MSAREISVPNPILSWLDTCWATAVSQVSRTVAYRIEVVRWPVYPVIYYIMLLITYRVAGRQTVAGIEPEAFLLVGAWGMMLWTSAIWTSGSAIERERSEGTINSLFLTPASRSSVVMGYALGSLGIFVVPTMLALTGVAMFAGASFNVTDPLAMAVSALALLASSVVLGYFLAGAFVLTRRANMVANFIQSPIYLLSGMVIPISDLPAPLDSFASIFPLSAGMEALRGTLLRGETFGDVSGELLRFSILTVVLAIAGYWLIRRVEHVAKRGDQLDFD